MAVAGNDREGASPHIGAPSLLARKYPRGGAVRRGGQTAPLRHRNQTTRSTIIFLIWAIALAGFRPFGQVLAQFMIVWQR